MKNFSLFLAVWSIIIGAYIFIFTSGGVIKICIACNSFITNIFGMVSILVGVAGVISRLNIARLPSRQ